MIIFDVIDVTDVCNIAEMQIICRLKKQNIQIWSSQLLCEAI